MKKLGAFLCWVGAHRRGQCAHETEEGHSWQEFCDRCERWVGYDDLGW